MASERYRVNCKTVTHYLIIAGAAANAVSEVADGVLPFPVAQVVFEAFALSH